jgi:hypothetical protein
MEVIKAMVVQWFRHKPEFFVEGDSPADVFIKCLPENTRELRSTAYNFSSRTNFKRISFENHLFYTSNIMPT